MSIPHEDGISLVAFHVKFNEDFNGLEAGTIARDIVKVRNGHWTYEDRTTRLKRGDIIYYWIHVVYDGLGYNLLDQSTTVNNFYNYDGIPVGTGDVQNIVCSTPSATKILLNTQKAQQQNPRTICPGQLIFEENFDTLNISRWTIIERFSDAPNYEFVVYMNDRNNLDVEGGILHIQPVLTDERYREGYVRDGTIALSRCTGQINTSECKRTGYGWRILPPVISGRLNTMSSFAFLYGRIEVRAKLPRGDWIYPLLTLEATQREIQNSSVYCDIVLAYSAGNPSLRLEHSNGQDISGHILQSGAHATDVDQQQTNQLNLPTKFSTSLWSDNYHVYDLEWRRGKIIAKVDGELYGEQSVPALYETPVYLNLGVAVGGLTYFPDSSYSGNYEKPWRNVASKAQLQFYDAKTKWQETWKNTDTALHVDYIKVWAI
ncbi:beta-1,3-glucan recognition protein 1 [Xylocopa sonorina]|uniref:beta-1,3-glucan recognition protein 1 n=1 Tax=Xylocopa sonorina TaxID=1818115 RepID=UPI00403B04C9